MSFCLFFMFDFFGFATIALPQPNLNLNPTSTPPLPQPNLNLSLLVGGELLCLVPSRLVSHLVSRLISSCKLSIYSETSKTILILTLTLLNARFKVTDHQKLNLNLNFNLNLNPNLNLNLNINLNFYSNFINTRILSLMVVKT